MVQIIERNYKCLHRIYIKSEVFCFMKKLASVMTGKIYAAKRQYPMLEQFGKRMDTVKKELNKNVSSK